MGGSDSSSPWRKKCRLIVVMSVVTFSAVLLTNSLSDASPAADDPCADRPFKRWGKEIMHLVETAMTVTVPLFFKDMEELSTAERLQILEEKVRKVNPCAYHLVKESQAVEDPVSCEHWLPTVDRCDDDDNECAEYVLEQMVALYKCFV